MKQKKSVEAKSPAAQKPQDENALGSAISIAIGIVAVSIMALVIIWMMNILL